MRQVRKIMSGVLCVRTCLAEARDRTPDDLRIPGMGLFVSEASRLHRSGLCVLDHHVDCRRQPLQDRARCRVAKVQCHRALTTTQGDLPNHETWLALLRWGLHANNLRPEI